MKGSSVMDQTQVTKKLSLGSTSMEDLEVKLEELLRSSSSKDDFKTSCEKVFDNPTVTILFWEGSCRGASVCCDGYTQEIRVNVG